MEASNRAGRSPKIPRRSFLQGSTATLAAAALAPVGFFAGSAARADATAFTRLYFDERVGQFFHIDDGAWRSVELIHVVSHDVSLRLEQFTVRWRGSPHVAIEEGIYNVAPPAGAIFELHVQPAGADSDGSYYEASFSIIKPIVPSCAGTA